MNCFEIFNTVLFVNVNDDKDGRQTVWSCTCSIKLLAQQSGEK